MRELEIKLTSRQVSGEPVICIDDVPVNFKRNKSGSLICKHQTENDKVNIKVFKALDVGGILWFITKLFFFLISIFGILDSHYKERCLVIDFEMEVDLREENKIALQFNPLRANEKAITVQTDLTNRELSNNYYIDIKAKKTLKALKIAKIILTLAVIATAIAVLMVKL